mmetsp:Transcript_73806/g.205261  ORF Transcript_73806/g.205261 Transcript_73806/m.205261 type:complete len:239 (+) Transcript_73806:174-890(+)
MTECLSGMRTSPLASSSTSFARGRATSRSEEGVGNRRSRPHPERTWSRATSPWGTCLACRKRLPTSLKGRPFRRSTGKSSRKSKSSKSRSLSTEGRSPLWDSTRTLTTKWTRWNKQKVGEQVLAVKVTESTSRPKRSVAQSRATFSRRVTMASAITWTGLRQSRRKSHRQATQTSSRPPGSVARSRAMFSRKETMALATTWTGPRGSQKKRKHQHASERMIRRLQRHMLQSQWTMDML